MDRLVLGYRAIGHSFLERLSEHSESLLVLVPDAERAESLRDSGIDARHIDITVASDIRTVAGAVDSIVAAPGRGDYLQQVLTTADAAYPDTFLLACLDSGADPADRRAAESVADKVIDPDAELARTLSERVGDSGLRTRKLRGALKDIDGKLAIFAHDNPDPDAIAAAVGLGRIAATADVDAVACYYGEINHQENRALVNLFEYDLRNLDPDASLSEFDAFALVDHSQPGVNDSLPGDTDIDIVIDHHPPRGPVQARFVDLRSDVGATCTLIEEYIWRLGIEPNEALASGLLYGIRTDTGDFSRGVSAADFEAAARLVDPADDAALQRIESPSMTAETLETIGDAILNRSTDSEVLTSCVGRISDRDTLAQAADLLLDMEGVMIALVFGYTDDEVFLSARARGTDTDLGEVLREAFGQIGSAGGHTDMAGAQIPIGMLTQETDTDEQGDVIAEVVTERFLEALGITPDYAAAFVYSDIIGTGEEP